MGSQLKYDEIQSVTKEAADLNKSKLFDNTCVKIDKVIQDAAKLGIRKTNFRLNSEEETIAPMLIAEYSAFNCNMFNHMSEDINDYDFKYFEFSW